MTNIEIVQNEITFNAVKNEGIELSTSPIIVKGQIGTDDGKVVNAVDIDWNGAEVGAENPINTTGELLSWIKELGTSAAQPGENGKDGKDGKSAYELYKDNFVTEPDKVLIIDHTNFNDAVPAELKDYYTNYPNEAAGDGETWPPYNAAMFPWLYVGYNFDGKTTIKVYYKGEEKLTWKPSAQIEQVDASGQGTGNMVDRTYGIIGLPGDLGLDMFTESNDGNEILANIEDFKVELIKDELLSESEWLASLKGKDGAPGRDGSFDSSALENYATKAYVGTKIAELVGEADGTLDTLKEIGDLLQADDSKLGQLTNAIETKANVGDSYTKEESDNKYATKAELGTFGEETELEYEFINNAQSWQESYENGVLKKYYQKYPEEDLWNTVENRAVNFNDRYYHGNIGNEAIECGATWASERAQKLVINDVTYYAPIFYGMEAQDLELFNDINLTESTGLVFTIESVAYNGNCVHCWEGTVNAPGAKLPWVAISFEDDANVMIKFQYEGKDDVTPWNFTVFGAGEGHKAWGLASPASEFGDNDFAITENGGENAFDTNKFKVIGVSANVNIPAAIKAYVDMEIKKIKASL